MTKKGSKIYLRDGRAPIPLNENTSRVMSANKGKNTKPELTLRRALWASGIKGYRLHPKNVPGRPDIAFLGKKLAIFVHGCFWHRCPHCQNTLPKSNVEFWQNKFEKNVARDKGKMESLQNNGWKTEVIWECELKKDLESKVKEIQQLVSQ